MVFPSENTERILDFHTASSTSHEYGKDTNFYALVFTSGINSVYSDYCSMNFFRFVCSKIKINSGIGGDMSNQKEEKLLEFFRQLSEDDQDAALSTIVGLASNQRKARPIFKLIIGGITLTAPPTSGIGAKRF
jgi:hypothetical protein